MRSLRNLTLALATTLAVGPLAACAGKIKSGTEYDQQAKVSDYSTYAWVTEDLVLIRPGTGNENIRNVENEQRIRDAVDARLAAAGLNKVDKAEAELIVMFAVGTRTKPEIGGFLYNLSTSSSTYTEGTLQVDLFDAKTNAHVWHGWAQKALRPGEDPDAVVSAAAEAIFAGFPPS